MRFVVRQMGWLAPSVDYKAAFAESGSTTCGQVYSSNGNSMEWDTLGSIHIVCTVFRLCGTVNHHVPHGSLYTKLKVWNTLGDGSAALYFSMINVLGMSTERSPDADSELCGREVAHFSTYCTKVEIAGNTHSHCWWLGKCCLVYL